MNEYWQDLLTIRKKETKIINKLKIWMKWDSNDADYIERTEEMDPEVLFKNKKLIYCLAYITCYYGFKGHGWNDAVFNHHIPDNEDIDDLETVLSENNFVVDTDWGICHSCYGIEITYYDENGEPWDIRFDDIHKEWENMSYQEICDQINSIGDYE